mmetsp:Transcript_59042/g.141020  ORF Transcript_59042/g.141020 Transcript_59042/m.141020 type:complete len:88 (-) Transcript_59042:1869-2132(-)
MVAADAVQAGEVVAAAVQTLQQKEFLWERLPDPCLDCPSLGGSMMPWKEGRRWWREREAPKRHLQGYLVSCMQLAPCAQATVGLGEA